MTRLLADYLGSIVYFEELSRPSLDALTHQAARHLYTASEMIFVEGDSAAGLYVIEQGRVKIFKLNPEGGEHVLHILGEGNTFNDIAAFDGGANPANAAALSDAAVWIIPSTTLTAAILADGSLGLRVIRILAARVRRLVGQIEDLALYSVIVRLARFLLKQAEDPALSGPGVTRTAIAAHLATTPQTISNVLHTLEEAGAIRFDRHRIVIVSEDILRSIAML